MQRLAEINKRSIILNLLLFYSLFLGLVFTEKQMIKKGLLDIQLPIRLDMMMIMAGFILGSGIIILISSFAIKKGHYLRILLVVLFSAGSFLSNLHVNKNIFYPPYSIFAYGDLEELGENQWPHDYAFDMYSTMADKYYLETVLINPEINNLEEMVRVERFGVSIRESGEAPAVLSPQGMEILEQNLGDSYLQIDQGDFIYRFYDSKPGEEIILTRYSNLILFIPKTLFNE